MNFKRTILGVACAGVAAVTPFVMPMSVSASTVAVAVFSGSSSDTVQFVGGSGGFTFSTSAPLGCTEVIKVNEPPIPPAVSLAQACTISAAGNFMNIVCGTGLAGGTATVSDATQTITVNFVIVFVGGVGLLLPGAVPLPTSPGASAALTAGVVVITPNSLQTPGTNPSATCTFGFTVNSVSGLIVP